MSLYVATRATSAALRKRVDTLLTRYGEQAVPVTDALATAADYLDQQAGEWARAHGHPESMPVKTPLATLW